MFTILNTLKPVFSDIFAVDEEDISPATRFEDFCADELDMAEIAMVVEEEFDVLIDDEDLKKFSTVGDLIAYIERNRNE